jgi:hypothetical protein
MLVVPDPTTAFLDPFTTHQSRCPRSLLRHRLRAWRDGKNAARSPANP